MIEYLQDIYYYNDQDDKLADLLEGLIEKDPENVSYYYALSDAYYFLEDYEAAEQVLLDVKPYVTDDLEYQEVLYGFYRDTDQIDKASELIASLLASDPTNPDYVYMKVSSLDSSQDMNEIISIFADFEAKTSHVDMLKLRGEYWYYQDLEVYAIADFGSLVSLDPQNEEDYLTWIEDSVYYLEFDEADQALTKLVMDMPEHRGLIDLAADQYAYYGSVEGAVTYFEDLVNTGVDQAYAYYKLAGIAAYNDEFDLAKTYVDKAKAYTERAARQGADMVVLPEMFVCPYSHQSFKNFAQPEGGQTYRFLQDCAREFGMILFAGSVPELSLGNIYNTSYVFDEHGNLIGKHRKVHLFDVDVPGGLVFKESATLTAGNKATLVETRFGTIGMCICFDIRFNELFTKMVLNGARLIMIPAAFNMTTGPLHWDLLARARALDHQVYVCLCSPARDHASDYVAYGHSMITHPWGHVVAQTDDQEGLLLESLD